MDKSKVSEQTAYTVLNYAIMEAIRHQKSVKINLQIPYSELAKSNGQKDGDKYPELGLTFEATLRWDELRPEEGTPVEEINE
jgi:hypothetical protein